MRHLRIGQGYDIHKLVEGRKLLLGGVEIPSDIGLLGHSDGDVLLHAICDALLGAANLGDLGTFFPSSEKQFKNISSIELLKQITILIKKQHFSISNIDSTIIAEKPKLLPYFKEMRKMIASVLDLPDDVVSIKAKTKDKLDSVGNLHAIEAHAVVLIYKD